jgi:hypothetical protein
MTSALVRPAAPSEWIFRPNRRRPELRLTDFQSWVYTQVRVKKKRVVVPVAARRSGKSVIARLLTILAGLDDRPGDVGYMAPTLEQARRLFWRPLLEDLKDPAARQFIVGRPNSQRMTLEFITGTRLYVYSAEAHERVRGDGFKQFITDETGDPLYTDTVFDDTIWPALGTERGQLVEIGTPKGRGRFYREWRKGQRSTPEKDRDRDYASCQVTALQAGIVPADEVERARRTRPKRSFQQEYEARFNAPLGLIYDEWNEARHVVPATTLPRLDEFDEIVVCKDWGVAKRGALLVLGIDHVHVPGDDEFDETFMPRVWVLEEHSTHGLAYTDAGWWKIARDVQRRFRPTVWYPDPAGGKHEADEARAAGLLLQLANVLAEVDNRVLVVPADNQVGPGISAVQQFLHYDDGLNEPPRLFVADTCKYLPDELGKYSWANSRGVAARGDDDGDAYEERPRKVNDHCIAAGSLVATEHGDVPIEDVEAGQRVWTRAGLRTVLASVMTSSNAPTLEIVTKTGHVVRATPEHRVWTEQRGWLAADLLRPGDLLAVLSKHGGFDSFGVSPVVAVRPSGRVEAVHDLTVEGEHEFFANGVLVHNCVDALRYGIFSHFYRGKRKPIGRNDVGHEDRGG